ncbi:MAG: hypothetical protein J6X43_10730 [Bacteroidales bacterium]|jgi:archaellum biogenesis protein FlaJ (TadC family)|nr:hypothetical protein [Bacteroidales bacterium]MBP5584401.1 hypothetical protein [Bacteroidales bacterium]
MRSKILLSVAFALGIAAMVLLILDTIGQATVAQSTITTLLVIGLLCVSIELIVSRKEQKDDDNSEISEQ